MTLHIDLDEDIKKELQAAAEHSGESLDQVANHIPRNALSTPVAKPFVIEPFALTYPDKWHGLTPSQIDYEMEIEHYEETIERSRHEHASVRT